MSQVPDFVLTTDVMIGFPGESSEQFENTVDLLLDTQPYKLHIFPYSTREGTRAARLEDLIDGNEMNRRRDALYCLEGKLRRTVQEHYLYKKLNVLTEEGNCGEGWVNARSANYLKVRFPGDRIPGINYQIEVTDINGTDLIGRVVSD
jgi:threonylcarbamoyladenosine tRNA methylthiotransferase MtaB